MALINTTQSRKDSRKRKVRAAAKAKREIEHYANVGTFQRTKSQTPIVTHKEPLVDEAFGIQRARNAQAKEGTPSPQERIIQIENELAHRHRIQRYNALEIGKLYYEAKRILPHGQFEAWVKKVGLYGKSAVVSYMRVYKFCCGRPELAEAIKPTHLQVICEPNFPRGLRQEIFDRGGLNGTVEQLKVVAVKVRNGRLSMKSKPVQRLLRDLEIESLENVMKQVIHALQDQVRNARQELQKLLPAKRDVTHSTGLVPVIDQHITECEAFERTLN